LDPWNVRILSVGNFIETNLEGREYGSVEWNQLAQDKGSE
jgi:hypothetical protein